ncbi:MAG TPA: hypothetical protein VHC22_20325 [Pirellulales bacterium]|nr:hypothetical protein [Pirellulales bacterium]
MSNNPFAELPNTNPYASPAPQPDSDSSANPLLIPGIFLLTLSLLFVFFILVSLPRQIDLMLAVDPSTPEGVGQLFGSVVSLTSWLMMNLGIAVGAISMIRQKSYRSAYLAAILAVIPVCSPCLLLGIPFGIWAIFLLNRPEVKQRFMKA